MSKKASASTPVDPFQLALQLATDPWTGAVVTMLWGFVASRWLSGAGAKLTAKFPRSNLVRGGLLALVCLPTLPWIYSDFQQGGLLFLYVLGPFVYCVAAAVVESIAALMKRFRAAIIPFCPIPLVVLLSALLQASLWVPILLFAYGLLASGILYPGRLAVKYMVENDVFQSAFFREFGAQLDRFFQQAVQGNLLMFILVIFRYWIASWLVLDIWRLPLLFHIFFVRPGFVKQHLLGVAMLLFWLFDANAQPLTTTIIAMSVLIWLDRQLLGERPPSRAPFPTGALPPIAFVRTAASHLPGAVVFLCYCAARTATGDAPSLLSVFAWFADHTFALVCISAAVSSIASARTDGLSWRHVAFAGFLVAVYLGKLAFRLGPQGSVSFSFGDAGGYSYTSYQWGDGDWGQQQGAGGRRAGGKRYGTIWDRWTNSDTEALRLLKLDSQSSNEDIVKACRREKKRWHPDKNLKNQEQATRMFQKIGAACDLLLKNS